MDKDLNFILDFLGVIAEIDACGEIWWRTDGKFAPVTFLINCNDLFYWASADCEEVNPENIHILKQAIEDSKELTDSHHALLLFCARVRNMRPQRPYYKYFSDGMKKLMDEAGPWRWPGSEG